MTTYSKTAESFRCDECNAEMAFPLFCDACGTDYPERRGMSAFGLLGLPITFGIDATEFDTRELLLAQRLHPDKWQGKGDRLHKRALMAQSAVNEALGKLTDPFVRAETLLDMRDEEVPNPKLPTTFLVEQLELQEEIEDGVQDPRKRQLKKEVRASLKELRGQLEAAWTQVEDGDADALTVVRDAVDRSRYWRNADRALRGQAPR
jgi:molecular chaperone HscB